MGRHDQLDSTRNRWAARAHVGETGRIKTRRLVRYSHLLEAFWACSGLRSRSHAHPATLAPVAPAVPIPFRGVRIRWALDRTTFFALVAPGNSNLALLICRCNGRQIQLMPDIFPSHVRPRFKASETWEYGICPWQRSHYLDRAFPLTS